MIGGFIYFDTPIDTSVIEADISDLQSEMATKVTQGGDDTGVFPLEVGTKTAQPFVITTNLLARIRVLANGRTLVQKTTDTGEALQVGGTVQADTVNSPNVGTTTAADAKFCANNVEGLRIFNATQNVAIGSATDGGEKLFVNGGIRLQNSMRIRSHMPNAVRISGDSNLDFETYTSGAYLRTNSGQLLFISNGGKITNFNGTDGTQAEFIHTSSMSEIVIRPNAPFRIRTNANATAVTLIQMATSGNILIGTTADSANLILNVASTTKAVRFAPMTTAQRILIASPPEGSFLYDTTLKTYCFFDGTGWRKISHSLA